jgi:hypothetical protein
MTETKHMTFDELMKVYDKAASNVAFLQYEGPDHRAGIRAVVEALRDELPRALSEVARKECCGQGNANRYSDQLECCDIPNLMVTTGQVYDAINEILAIAGEGKAHVCDGDVGPSLHQTPAAAPVCEWTMDTHPDDGSHYDTACGDAWCSILGGTPKQDNYSFCPSCGKPIKFKEDSE